jgi:DNA-binding SARP family transcriptional activator
MGDMSQLNIHLLGPVEASVDGRSLKLAGPQQRAVLAMLALHANEPVTTDRLIDGLWGDSPPPTAPKMIQIYVSQLRKLLAAASAEIVTRGGGYELRIDPDQVDAVRFARLVGDARHRSSDRGPPAKRTARDALALWEGTPLGELADEPFAAEEARRLEELRVTALEVAIDADLEDARHAEVIPDLEALVASHPLREHFHAQRMLALYRSGRQAEALEGFQQARGMLVAELGLEPGRELQRLHEAILRQDAALDVPGQELPPALDVAETPIVGREAELRRLDDRWRSAQGGEGRAVLLIGEAGIGKTRLAAEVARQARAAGAVVLYVSGAAAARESAQRLLAGGAAASRPTLLVADDLDAAGDAIIDGVDAACVAARRRPLLLVAAFRDARSRTARALVPRARAVGADVIELGALSDDGVRRIAERYAGDAAVVPVAALARTSRGVPARVHAAVAAWDRERAADRLAASAARAAAGRERLRALEAEVAGDVTDLQVARERAHVTEDRDPARGVTCPFKGLAPFEAADAPFYFGRERLVAEVVARLVGSSLLGVVGASGSGKSSAVHAGLIPALGEGALPGSEAWRQVLLRPGEHPVAELRRALGAPDGADLATAVRRAGAGRRLIVAADQFEEVFTRCRDAAERALFIDALVAAATDPAKRVVIVLVIRSDFYGRCAQHVELAEMVSAHHVLVRPPQADELRLAIEGPARKAGLIVDRTLVDALVDDVAGQAGALPLLSTALLELWQGRDGRRLRLETYQATDGVRGAVARLAEDTYGRLEPAEQAVARRILLRLCDGGRGEGATRNRVTLDELDVERDEVSGRVLAALAADRLVALGNGSAEVAHEALLTEWPRLRVWLDEDAEGRRLHRHVSSAARDWDACGRDPGDLYRGSRLVSALDWASERVVELNALERVFLQAGRGQSEHEARVARTTNRRLRSLLVGVCVVLALAVAAGITALEQRGSAARSDVPTAAAILRGQAAVGQRLGASPVLGRSAAGSAGASQTQGRPAAVNPASATGAQSCRGRGRAGASGAAGSAARPTPAVARCARTRAPRRRSP